MHNQEQNWRAERELKDMPHGDEKNHSTMGWLPWGNKSQDISEPTRQNRQKCWETRDSYFDCLDRANVIKPGDEGSSCVKEKQLYEDNCAKSWITYFNQRRVIADAQKDRLGQAKAQADNAKK